MPVVTPTEEQNIKTYDFKRPDKFTLDQIRTVELIGETFARLATAALTAMLRCDFSVKIKKVDQISFREYLKEIPDPSPMAIFHPQPLKGSAIFHIERMLMQAIIGRLAGKAVPGKQNIRKEFTDIDHDITMGLIVRLFPYLKQAFSTCFDMNPQLGQIETNPQFALIVPPTEVVLVLLLEARMNDINSCITLCFPFLTLEPVLKKLEAAYWYSLVRPKQYGPKVPVGLLPIHTEFYCEVSELSLHELGKLKPGDLVPVPHPEKICMSQGRKKLLFLKGNPVKDKKWVFKVMNVSRSLNRFMAGLRPSPAQKSQGSLSGTSGKSSDMTGDAFSLAKALKPLEAKIEELSHQQVQLADQIYFQFSQSEKDHIQIEESPFHFLEQYEKELIAPLLAKEHPQIIALVLSLTDSLYASEILKSWTVDVQKDMLKRIEDMQPIAPAVLDEIVKVLKKKTQNTGKAYRPGGSEKKEDIQRLLGTKH